jgi:hypothetical protein
LGYDFSYYPEYGVVPLCRFGGKVVKAQFDSTVKIICETPQSKPAVDLPFEVSLNGVDWSETGFSFTFFDEPVMKTYSPSQGKVHGGTVVNIFGNNFPNITDISQFNVKFTPQKNPKAFKIMPLKWHNSSCVSVFTPGGWDQGDIMNM